MKKAKVVKIKTKGKKKATSGNPVWTDECSLVEVEKNKCTINFPDAEYVKDAFDEDLGLIAVLIREGIYFGKVYRKNSGFTYENGQRGTEIVYEFKKNQAKKIKEVEKAYFTGRIKIEAVEMSRLLIIAVINYFDPKGWKPKFLSKAQIEAKR
ncbi:MAG TPA: hypothetical protein VJH67_01660 [Candidatus Paceibacterota bacterium]